MGHTLVTINTTAFAAAQHSVVTGCLTVEGGNGLHLLALVAADAACGMVGFHPRLSAFMIMGVVAAAAGRIFRAHATETVYALNQFLVTTGAYLLLVLRR